jgi:hypothetical protein
MAVRLWGFLCKAQEEEQHSPLSTWYSAGYLFSGHFLSHILSQKFQLKAKKIHPPPIDLRSFSFMRVGCGMDM